MSTLVMDWFKRQADARQRFRKCVGARRADFSESLSKAMVQLSGDGFASRTADGPFGIAEVWTPPFEHRIAAMRTLIARGWKVALLPTRFSTHAVGKRQPVVLVPPGSDVDPQVIFTKLKTANFEGVSDHDP